MRVRLADQAQSLYPGGQRPRERDGISAFGKFAAAARPLEFHPEHRLDALEASAHTRGGAPVEARHLGSAVADEAAAPAGTGDNRVDQRVEEGLYAFPDCPPATR